MNFTEAKHFADTAGCVLAVIIKNNEDFDILTAFLE